MAGQPMTDTLAFEVALGLAALIAGFLAGIGHFRALHGGTRAFTEGATGRALGLLALRFALTVAVLAGAAALGTLPLLAAALGLWCGRMRVLAAVRRLDGGGTP